MNPDLKKLTLFQTGYPSCSTNGEKMSDNATTLYYEIGWAKG
jgi:hypothetical protein